MKDRPGYFTHDHEEYRWVDEGHGYVLQQRLSNAYGTCSRSCWVTVSYLKPALATKAVAALTVLVETEEQRWVELYTSADGDRIEATRDGTRSRYWAAGANRPVDQSDSAFLACYRAGLKVGREDR